MYDIRELEEVAPCGCNKRLECGKCSRGKQIKERERHLTKKKKKKREGETQTKHHKANTLTSLVTRAPSIIATTLTLLSHAYCLYTRVICYFLHLPIGSVKIFTLLIATHEIISFLG